MSHCLHLADHRSGKMAAAYEYSVFENVLKRTYSKNQDFYDAYWDEFMEPNQKPPETSSMMKLVLLNAYSNGRVQLLHPSKTGGQSFVYNHKNQKMPYFVGNCSPLLDGVRTKGNTPWHDPNPMEHIDSEVSKWFIYWLPERSELDRLLSEFTCPWAGVYAVRLIKKSAHGNVNLEEVVSNYADYLEDWKGWYHLEEGAGSNHSIPVACYQKQNAISFDISEMDGVLQGLSELLNWDRPIVRRNTKNMGLIQLLMQQKKMTEDEQFSFDVLERVVPGIKQKMIHLAQKKTNFNGQPTKCNSFGGKGGKGGKGLGKGAKGGGKGSGKGAKGGGKGSGKGGKGGKDNYRGWHN